MDLGADQDIYLARVQWLPDGSLSAQIENRAQTTLDLVQFDPSSGERRDLLREQSDTWINLHQIFRPLRSGGHAGGLIWASERDGFQHLYLYDREGKLIRQLTHGEWMVESLAGVDEARGLVYFTATRESPLETLFPGGSFELALGLYERSATMRYINQLAAAALEAITRSIPPTRSVRVLEIGAGTGGTSSSLLPVLPPGRSRYRFTDISQAFLEPARQRFGQLPGVEFGLLDLERDTDGQGHAHGSFDVIVAANAVHAVKDLRGALVRLRELLAPGGMLMLVESTEHLAYFDMTTGLIEGWQHFADDLRGEHPLLGPEAWLGALRVAGFAACGAWPPRGSVAEAMGQHVVVAQVAGDAIGGSTTASAAEAAEAAAAMPAVESAPAWRERFDSTAPAGQIDLLRELVRDQVMHILRLNPASPPSLHDRLMDLGMDSLMAVQLRNGLSRALQLPRALPSTLMFDYPTIDAIASHLLQRLNPAAPPAPATPATAVSPTPPMKAADVAAMSDDDISRLLDERWGDR